MARLRLVGTSGALLAGLLTLLLNGCSDNKKCIYFSMRFQGISHFATVSPDSSIALGVSGNGKKVVGAAADRHSTSSTTFGRGTTGVLWAEKYQPLPCPGKVGTGIERLPLCQDADLAEPVLGTAFGLEPSGVDAVGSVTCHGVQVPVDWDCNGMTLLPSPFAPQGSGIARARSNNGVWAAAGFMTGFQTASPEDSGGSAVIWTNDGLSGGQTKVVLLGGPGGLPSSDAFAVFAAPLGFGGVVAGIGYDETIGREASSVPAAWNFVKKMPVAWKGTWVPIELKDDTGAPARGAAMAITDHASAIFGDIVKGSVAQACMWPLAGSPASIPATLLPSPPGITGSHINSVGHDGTVAVGYGLSPSGPKAIGYIGGKPVIIKDEINSLYPGTIPANWDLQEATAVSFEADDDVAHNNLDLLSWAIVGRGSHAGVPEGWVLRFERVKLPWYQCVITPLFVFKDPHLYRWPPRFFGPGDPAFRGALARSRAPVAPVARTH